MTLSLTIVDTRDHHLANLAVAQSARVLEKVHSLDKIYWYSDRQMTTSVDNIPVQWIKINPIEQFPHDYNRVMMCLMPHIASERFNLVIQTDGYPCNPEAWSHDFLQYDYIGASWPWESLSVGNGGFSLRSRALLDALLQVDLSEFFHHPEDVAICRMLRPMLEQDYQIRFAPAELADRFSVEFNTHSSWLGTSFGFHGKHTEVLENYPRLT